MEHCEPLFVSLLFVLQWSYGLLLTSKAVPKLFVTTVLPMLNKFTAVQE